jgi:RNA polymerase sigma-70 factor (ECF subfamily)
LSPHRIGDGADAEAVPAAAAMPAPLDPDSRAWLDALSAEGTAREEAVRRLHALLMRAARFQLGRASAGWQLRGESVDDVATEVANEALVTILSHRSDFRGASRFVTWASKFVIFEVSAARRRRLWKARELPLEPDGWARLELAAARSDGAEGTLEQFEWLRALRVAIDDRLSERQRLVFVAVALNEVPIDVVAERLGASRGAVYKTLHDARRKLRAHLAQEHEGG